MKVISNEEWVETQFGNCELGNSLRTKRLKSVAAAMLKSPERSLPKQNTSWKDVKAAYRFFNASGVTFKSVAQKHWEQTRKTPAGRHLLISDTTDIDKLSHPATEGLGMLGGGTGRGVQLHSCLVFNGNTKQLVGSAGALLHYRKRACKRETRMQRLGRERESEIWGNLVEQIGPPPTGSQWIHVFDRGGDNFEALCHIRLTKCDWIIRAAKLQRNVIATSCAVLPLGSAIKEAEYLGQYDLTLRSRPGVKARTARLIVSATKITLPRPRHCSQWVKDTGITEIESNVVIVREEKARKGVKPICWVLLTSLPTRTLTQAWQVIDDYEHRWMIEEFHKIIKSGCSIEKHALRTADRLEPLIGLIAVMGTRLLQLKYIGRNQPNAKARTHVPKDWLKALILIRPELKPAELTVYSFFRELAKLGGFLARKGDGEPGWETVWTGFQKLQLLLDGMRLIAPI